MGGTGIMPTVVEKGWRYLEYDRLYSDPVRRFDALLDLREALAKGDTAYDTDSIKSVVNAGERQHDETDWFGPPDTGNSHQAGNNWWRVINEVGDDFDIGEMATVGGVSQQDAWLARDTITWAIIEALEISLGLDDGEGTRDDLKNMRRGKWIPSRDIPLDVHWVCGKGDGFETLISWNARQVNVFIVTPPVYHGFDIAPLASLGQGYPARRRKAKKDEARGFIVVRGKKGIGPRRSDDPARYQKFLLHMDNGGVTKD